MLAGNSLPNAAAQLRIGYCTPSIPTIRIGLQSVGLSADTALSSIECMDVLRFSVVGHPQVVLFLHLIEAGWLYSSGSVQKFEAVSYSPHQSLDVGQCMSRTGSAQID